MDEYKPKRIDFHKFEKGQRSLGVCITKETYHYRDYYIFLNLWWWNFTLVFLRLKVNK